MIAASKIARDVTERTTTARSAQHLAAIHRSFLRRCHHQQGHQRHHPDLEPVCERVFGYTPDEIIGRSVLTLIPSERHHEEDVILGKIRCGERIEHFETVRQTKDGRLVDISLTVSPIKDRHGKVIGASKIARDITERKRAEALLEQQAQRLAALNRELERRSRNAPRI